MTRPISKAVKSRILEGDLWKGKQYPIDEHIEPWHNTITLVIGERNSGKTYSTLQQVLSIFVDNMNAKEDNEIQDPITGMVDVIPPNERKNYNYQYCLYVSGGDVDDAMVKSKTPETDMTVSKFLFPKGTFASVSTRDPRRLLQLITSVEDSNRSNNKESIIIFDDSMYVLQGQSKQAQAIQAKLFKNRQPQITYFILLQDEVGVSPAMKHNANFLKLYGGLGPESWARLWKRINPPEGLTYDEYKALSSKDYLLINLITKTYERVDRN